MAKNGFVPAWMKIPNSDKTNGNQKLTNKSNEQQQTDQTSIWNNAASKFRFSNNEKFSRTFNSNRILNRKDRSNNLLQTNCITQTKNLDKRSDFFNSLKNDLTIDGNKNHYNQFKKRTLLLLSVSETSEEKDLLMRMGWNDNMTYEITEKDKEEYEKRIKLLPKTDNRSARLISALNRRSLPCINIQDILQLEMFGSASDDDSSDD